MLVAPPRFVPVIVPLVPADPLDGLIVAIVGPVAPNVTGWVLGAGIAGTAANAGGVFEFCDT